ncbi:MAG: oxidoreductase [Bacteroidota bacterium]
MSGKTALLFGGTGLVGQALHQLLDSDDDWEKIYFFSRRDLAVASAKTEIVVVDFDAIPADTLRGDAIFCCIGTTIKKAGSEEAFRQIDHHIPLEIGRIGKKNQVPQYLLVSANGADSESWFFYNRVKGDLEKDLQALDFQDLKILRPGLLLGDREEYRMGESMAQVVMNAFAPILPSSYKPISAQTVAQAMWQLSSQAPQASSQQIWSNTELLELGK